MSKKESFKRSDRRKILAAIAAGATLSLPRWSLAENALWMPNDLPLTPQQTEGPFYPEQSIEQQLYNDTDMSRKIGGHEFAKGQKVVVTGQVMNRKGKPIRRSIVEAWQACASGRYKHSRDNKNPALLDNNFQFWGRAITGADGRYSFTTIIPGKYPGRNGRHIHFRVDADGFKRCSTQCYFSDFGEDNMREGIYQRLSATDRKLVMVEFDKSPKSQEATKSVDTRKPSEKLNGTAKGTETLKVALPKKPWVGAFNIVVAEK